MYHVSYTRDDVPCVLTFRRFVVSLLELKPVLPAATTDTLIYQKVSLNRIGIKSPYRYLYIYICFLSFPKKVYFHVLERDSTNLFVFSEWPSPTRTRSSNYYSDGKVHYGKQYGNIFLFFSQCITLSMHITGL